MLKLLYFIGRARREELQHLAWYSDVRVQSLQRSLYRFRAWEIDAEKSGNYFTLQYFFKYIENLSPRKTNHGLYISTLVRRRVRQEQCSRIT